MFAGLPGIGVGTLFYVLAAFWMPFPELIKLAQGTSSVARWQRIFRQLFFAFSIVLSIMIAERVLLWILGAGGPGSFSPAHWIGREVNSRAPSSLLAAPVAVSLMLLAVVLLTVEVLRLIGMARKLRREPGVKLSDALRSDAMQQDALNSTPQ